MDQFIDARFERLEKALSNLIDSVTKYHPSIIKAEELKSADEDLSRGLEQVQIHQNNHLRIQSLRQASAALDSRIRDTLTSLANTRNDIVTTHTTTFPSEPSHPIAYEELLSYARRISKTTLPPATILASSATLPPATQSPRAESQSQTPSAANHVSQPQSPAVNGAPATSSEQQPSQQTLTSTNTSLPEGMSQWLNPLSGQLFFPWPMEDKIRSGALASYQMLVEQGIDPKGYDPATEEERKRKEEEERKVKEEREKAERDERERQLRVEREKARAEIERQREKDQEAWRRTSLSTGQSEGPGPSRPSINAGEKKQFQFTTWDDLDDDDEDDEDDD